jgi:hypothetical protein
MLIARSGAISAGIAVVAALGCAKPTNKRLTARVEFAVAQPSAAFGYSSAELLTLLREADCAWRATCTEVSLPELNFRLGADREPVARDARNVVRVLTGRFCPDGARDSIDCYGAMRAAITHIYPPLDESKFDFVSRLPEMDIELNGADFSWKDLGRDALQETLVHELGHVFGLQHACEVPQCDDKVRRSVMYPYPLEAGRARLLGPTREDCRVLRRTVGD